MAQNNKKLILLADDEPDILKLYGGVLKDNGFEVIEASNGKEAIDLAKAKKPDLVLLDIKMPVMDGVETFYKLKEDPETKDMRIVFLTAFSDPVYPETDIRFAKEEGALDYIVKGLPLDEFVSKVKGYLNS